MNKAEQLTIECLIEYCDELIGYAQADHNVSVEAAITNVKARIAAMAAPAPQAAPAPKREYPPHNASSPIKKLFNQAVEAGLTGIWIQVVRGQGYLFSCDQINGKVFFESMAKGIRYLTAWKLGKQQPPASWLRAGNGCYISSDLIRDWLHELGERDAWYKEQDQKAVKNV
jgi:hypothetical protein